MKSRTSIIDYCNSVIGCSYDTTPSGGVEYESYNCSYLTWCAYQSAGLDIPTWQGHQNGEGSQSDWVRWSGNWKWTVDELEAGDLLFFGSSPYDTYHVGIYVGDGMMIDSIPDGGVQKRFVYDTFCGGGWPFEKRDEVKSDMILECIIEVEEGTALYFDGHDIHDLTDMEDVWLLDKIARNNCARDMPRLQLTCDEFARLCQVVTAGIPKHLDELLNKYPARSRK